MYQVSRTACGGNLLQLAGTGAECGKERCVIAAKYAEWLTDDGLLLIRGWARDGLTEKQIAQERMHIAYSTFNEWKKRFPELSEALKKSKSYVDAELEETAFDHANGKVFVKETVTDIQYEGVDENGNPIEVSRHTREIIRQVPPNATMQIFLMKNRVPEKYREKREEQIQVTNADYSLLDGISKSVTVPDGDPEGDPDE